MTNKDITKIYFRGNEIVALYQGSTLIFKKSGSGKSIIRGKVYNINTPVKIRINGGEYITVSVNEDKTFEYNIVDTITNCHSMFAKLDNNVDTLDLSNFDTSNVTDMSDMFKWSKIKNLYINFNVDKVVSNFSNIFNCSSLTNVVGKFEGTKNDLWITRAPLTAASTMVFINGLATVTEKRTLTLNATTYDSLTPEQIAVATSKGWNVARN